MVKRTINDVKKNLAKGGVNYTSSIQWKIGLFELLEKVAMYRINFFPVH